MPRQQLFIFTIVYTRLRGRLTRRKGVRLLRQVWLLEQDSTNQGHKVGVKQSCTLDHNNILCLTWLSTRS